MATYLKIYDAALIEKLPIAVAALKGVFRISS